MNPFALVLAALSLQLPLYQVAGTPRCHVVPTYLERALDRVRMLVTQLDDRRAEQCSTQRFAGSLYGVAASVELDLRTRKARVELRSIPLGGRVAGVGWLKNVDGEAGEVELEEEFAAKLAWRRVSIQAASLDRASNTVTVHVTVPLLGLQKLELQRVSAESED